MSKESIRTLRAAVTIARREAEKGITEMDSAALKLAACYFAEIAKNLREIAGVCRRCGKAKRPAQVYCGASCSQLAEMRR